MSFGTHTEVICGLKLDCVSRPGAWYIGMGELHLKRRRLSFCGFNVSQSSLDCDFSSCKEHCKHHSSPTSTSSFSYLLCGYIVLVLFGIMKTE